MNTPLERPDGARRKIFAAGIERNGVGRISEDGGLIPGGHRADRPQHGMWGIAQKKQSVCKKACPCWQPQGHCAVSFGLFGRPYSGS